MTILRLLIFFIGFVVGFMAEFENPNVPQPAPQAPGGLQSVNRRLMDLGQLDAGRKLG